MHRAVAAASKTRCSVAQGASCSRVARPTPRLVSRRGTAPACMRHRHCRCLIGGVGQPPLPDASHIGPAGGASRLMFGDERRAAGARGLGPEPCQALPHGSACVSAFALYCITAGPPSPAHCQPAARGLARPRPTWHGVDARKYMWSYQRFHATRTCEPTVEQLPSWSACCG